MVTNRVGADAGPSPISEVAVVRAAIISLVVFSVVPRVGAQVPPDTAQTDSITVFESTEQILDVGGSDSDASAHTVEVLGTLANDPLDINRASAAELSAIPALSPPLAHRMVQHRRENGPFRTVSELTTVSGVDHAHLRALRPYLTVSRPESDRSTSSTSPSDVPSLDTLRSALEVSLLQRVTRDLDLGRGYAPDSTRTTFLGSPERLTTRFRLTADRYFQFALTLDKDPGEALLWAPDAHTYGFDHVAGNLTLQNWGPLETLIVGDYTAEYGQGVALWQGLAFGKGRNPVSPLVRNGRGIVSFQSTSENRYFRGAAAAAAVTPAISASAFASRRHRDATLDSSAAEATGSSSLIPARTLSSGGRHRTPSELRRKGTFGTTTVGGALEYRSGGTHVGVAGYRAWFDRPLQPPSDPYQRFDVAGRECGMISAFADAYLDPYTIFGEVARSFDGVFGAVGGAALNAERGVDAVIFGRHLPPAFAGLYNSAIGESSDTQNEQGIYTGVRLRVSDRWRIGAYVDQYRFPWARYGVSRPSRGLDARLVVSYDPWPWLSSYVQLRAEREEEGTDRPGPGKRLLAAVQTEHRQSARWHLEYRFSDHLVTRTRVQLSRFQAAAQNASYGALLSQGVRLQPTTSLQFDARLAYFDTGGYASRLYAYEHDLLYSFSVPVLYGRGRRSYVLVKYSPLATLTIEAKYGVTQYPLRREIGSGLNTIEGNRSRELRVQVRWQY